jgi:5-aminopentanamidase
MTDIIRLALAQVPSAYYDKEANLERAERAMRNASREGAAAILFPEMFLTGYLVWDRIAELAEPLEGPSISRLRELAAKFRILTICGFPETDVDGALYNSACVIERDGRLLGAYRKTHLFADEPRAISAGNQLPVFETVLGPTGILICYDVEFPEAARALSLGGAHVVLVPTANMEPYELSQDVYLRSRALENGIFVATTNTVGADEMYRYFGKSAVADPKGNVVARAGDDQEIVVADLDLSMSAEAQLGSPYLDRRRPSLYAALAARSESPTA